MSVLTHADEAVAELFAQANYSGVAQRTMTPVWDSSRSAHHKLRLAQGTASVAKMKRLYKLLQRLSHERRRAVLQRSFMQEQRLALERWILEQRQITGAVAASKSIKKQALTALPCKRSLQNDTSDRMARWARCAQSSIESKDTSQNNSVQLRTRGIAVHRRKQGSCYSALVLFERLELRSREVSDFQVALTHLTVLRATKGALYTKMQELSLVPSPATDGDSGTAMEALRSVLQSVILDVCTAYGIDADCDLGLYLRVNTPARKWIGASLCGPVFHLRKGLEQGLHGWRLMQVAVSSAQSSVMHRPSQMWERLRKAYLTIWSSAGRDLVTLASHLDALRERHALSRQARLRGKRPTQCTASNTVVAAKGFLQEKFGVARAARSELLANRAEAQIRSIVCQWRSRLINASVRTVAAVARTPSARERNRRAPPSKTRRHKRKCRSLG